MYIEEYEKIEIKFKKIDKRWVNKIGKYDINKTILIDWKLLKYSSFRTLFMNVMCDDCNIIYPRRLRDLDENNNIHYCSKCFCKGERNYGYGKMMPESTKRALSKWVNSSDNIFKNKEFQQDLRKREDWNKRYNKIRGQKRSEDVKNKMSISAIEGFKNGSRKTSSGWGKIKIKNYKGLDYQSSYELEFIKYFEYIGIIDKLERGPIITYFDENEKEHTYHIDFKIKGTDIVFEIKSSYLWQKNLIINEIKRCEAAKIYNYNLIIDKDHSRINSILDEYKII